MSEQAKKQPAFIPSAEDRYRLLVESVKDYAIFMLGPDGRVATWSIGAELVKGYTAQEIIGKPYSIFFTPEGQLAGKPDYLLKTALVEGRTEDEGWRVRKDGTRFWADAVLTRIVDAQGHHVGFSKVTRDLTTRRRNEEALRESEERFRLLVDSVKDYAIFMLDPRGCVATWNTGAERIKGYVASEIVGQHFSRFYPTEDVAAGKCDYELEVASHEGHFEDEGWRIRKDGTRFWASVVITPVRGEGGQLMGFTKVTRDLTERRRLEEERLRLGQAREAIRLRDDFLSIASHELRTPLTALQLQLQAVADIAAGQARVVKKTERALRSSQRLSDLVDALLDVSRIATGRFELKPVPLDLTVLVQEVLEHYRETAERAHSEVHLESSGPVLGSWDRLRIEQVVTNLIGNAFKYAAGTAIDLKVSERGDLAVLEIRDHGPGIPAEDLSRIFGRFERAASMRQYGGLGLGLYVTQQIVRAHQGEVAAENAAGGGARFTIRLPKHPPTQ